MSELKEPKLPPRQRTSFLESAPGMDREENFRKFCEAFAEIGLAADANRSRPLAAGGFRFTARITKTNVAGLLWIKSEQFAAALHESTPDGLKDKICLYLAVSGSANVLSYGHSSQLQAGSILLTSAPVPAVITTGRASELFVMIVREDYFYTHAGFHAAAYIGRVIENSSPIRRFFSRTLAAVVRDISNVDARDVANICDGLLCMFRCVLMEINRNEQRRQEHRTPDFLRECALECMDHLLADPDLSVGRIAKEVGITPRYLSMLFRRAGTTVMKELMQLRLRKAAVQLREGHLAGRTVAGIARANGFRSPSHFSRLFKQFYGQSPACWRRGGTRPDSV